MKHRIIPTIDCVFKSILGSIEHKHVLIHFLNSIIEPETPLKSVEILNPFNEKEFVGDKLSQKAREVYYDKKTKKSIYGTATPEEKDELAEEGIDLLSVPWVDKDN